MTKRYTGYCPEHRLPIKRGQTVTIKKGTMVKTVGKPEKAAGRTYKIKVHHLMCGSVEYTSHHGELVHAVNPKVCWPGPGGYWSEADINDIPEAAPATEYEVNVDGKVFFVDLKDAEVDVYYSMLDGLVSSSHAGCAKLVDGVLTNRDSRTLKDAQWDVIEAQLTQLIAKSISV